MGKRPRYCIVKQDSEAVVIRDIGPWDKVPTVTNGAEEVIDELTVNGKLDNSKRLLYYDSEGEPGEIIHKDGEFVRFNNSPLMDKGVGRG